MPLKSCSKDGKSGFSWGNGNCIIRDTPEEAKKVALKQGMAIEGLSKFKKIMEHGKSALAYFGDRETLSLAKALYDEEMKTGASNKFIHSIASYLSKADDGQNDSDKNISDMLDNKEDKACTAEKGQDETYIDNAGNLSGNPANTGDGSGNEFNRPAKDDHNPLNVSTKSSVEIKDPNRGPVVKDNYKSGDECKQPPSVKSSEDQYGKDKKDDQDGDEPDPKVKTKSSLADGKPSEKVIDPDETRNDDPSLDKKRDQPAGNIVTPTYNKEASPETSENKKVPNYNPPSRTETTPPNTDNRTTFSPKIQYQTKSENDKRFGMQDEGENKDKKAIGDGSINDIKESEDIVRKSVSNIYSTEEKEAVEAAEAFWKVYAYISAEERKKVNPSHFAGPHSTYPIRPGHPEDVQHAAELLHHSADPTQVKKNVIRLAHQFNFPIPHSWRKADEKGKAYDMALSLYNTMSKSEKEKLCAHLNNGINWEENAVNSPNNSGIDEKIN